MLILLTIVAFAMISVGLLFLYAFAIERYIVRYNKYRISVPNLPIEFDGLKIVHISDVHLGPLVPHWYLKKLFKKVAAIEKDLIVCTGDYVSGRNKPARVEKAWSLLRELNAPYGVYSVLGNCDHWADAQLSLLNLKQSGQDVRGIAKPVIKEGKSIWIAGAGDLWEDHLAIDSILRDIPRDDCRIVLAHNPDSADTDFSVRIDLMIAGHTHGGQVKIPFYGIPKLPVENKEYSFGLKKSKKNQLVFISKGIGWGIAPLRFGCFPEIPILTLISVKSARAPKQEPT